MTKKSELVSGAFYWVVPTLDPDTDEEWELEKQPARFIDHEGECGERWHCLNIDGPSEWPMRWVGPRIEEPN